MGSDIVNVDYVAHLKFKMRDARTRKKIKSKNVHLTFFFSFNLLCHNICSHSFSGRNFSQNHYQCTRNALHFFFIPSNTQSFNVFFFLFVYRYLYIVISFCPPASVSLFHLLFLTCVRNFSQ